MTAVNPPGPSAYAVTPLTNPDQSGLVSDETGVPVLGPVLQPNSNSIQNIINAATGQGIVGGSGVPPLNAILIELRVLNSILLYSLGATPLDMDQMRADEAYNVSLSSGATIP